MPIRGIGFTAQFSAWDTAANEAKTGDAANISAYSAADGSAAALAASVAEVDATNLPGIYSVEVAAGECDCTTLSIGGKSATDGVSIIPVHYAMDPLYGSKVTLTLEDGDAAGVSGIRFQVYDSAGNLVCTGTTGALGVATIAVSDGSYTVAYGPAAAYSFSNPYTLTVSSTTAAAHTCAAIAIPASTDPELCTVYGYLRGAGGVLVGEGVGSITVTGVPYNQPVVSTDSIIGYSATDVALTNSVGLVELELIRGLEYTLEVDNGLTTRKISLTVPDAESYNLTAQL